MPLPRSTRWLLFASLLAVLAVGAWRFWPRPVTPPPAVRNPEKLWMFEQPQRGRVYSSPCLAGGRVFVGAIHDIAFDSHGCVYALDADTGKRLWMFDNDGQMRFTFSSPAMADGRLFIGEGGHGNKSTHLFALDVATGRKLWDYPVASHVESSPAVVDGVVYFGGGDEGLLAVDTVTGTRKWQFNEALHIDTSPALMDGRVYAGSGDNKQYQTLQFICLNAATGAPVWRIPSELPVWGSPLAADGRVYFGIGQSNLLAPRKPQPGGGLICLDAATGKRQWYCDVGSAVTCTPAIDAERVYFGADDGMVYAAGRSDGQVAWKAALGSGIIAAPVLLDGRLYVIASGGRVACLDPASGRLLSQFDLAADSGTRPKLFSSPLVVPDLATGRHRVYFGAELDTGSGNIAAVYCLRW
ncbi:MAG: PQQ-binding-like beta-propeller repeat protein [Gemmataceae bacterium]